MAEPHPSVPIMLRTNRSASAALIAAARSLVLEFPFRAADFFVTFAMAPTSQGARKVILAIVGCKGRHAAHKTRGSLRVAGPTQSRSGILRPRRASLCLTPSPN